MKRPLLALAFVVPLLPQAAAAELIKIATWNIENLRAEPGTGLNPRTLEDYVRLAAVAGRLDADIVALQEVENAAAAARVFPAEAYDFFLSRREIHPNERQQIRTGFAVRKGLEVVQHEDLAALDVSGGLRHGTDITVTIGDRAVRLLSVHLKSGCFDRPLNASADACVKLNSQVPVVERWIDARAAAGEPFIVMGDWNRRFDAPADTFWPEIDDGEPAGADLTRVTEGRTSACWGGEFPLYIDHIVLGAQAAGWLIGGSFEQVLFEEDIALQDVLSDHCALAVRLDVPGERAVGRREELLERIGAIEAELEELRRIVEGLE